MTKVLNKITLVLLLLGSDSCGPGDRKAAPAAPPADLSTKAELYSNLLTTASDGDGFLFTERCDSLLFSGLYGAVVPGRVNLEEAELSPGQWTRRPPKYGKCARPLSRDAIRGVLYWSVFNDRPDTLVNLWDFLQDSGGFVDSGADSMLTPHLLGLLARALKYVGRCDSICQVASLAPNPWLPNALGFEAHLQALDALMEVHLSGGDVPSGAVHRVSEAWVRNPANPLMAALVYRLTGSPEAAALARGSLNDESKWPSDRLPNADTICDEWPTQREYGPDWSPCPPNFAPSEGADFRGAGAAWLFSYFVLTSDKIGRGGPSTHEAIRSAITQAGDGATRMYRRGTSASGLSTKWDRKSRGSAQKGLENWEDNNVAPDP